MTNTISIHCLRYQYQNVYKSIGTYILRTMTNRQIYFTAKMVSYRIRIGILFRFRNIAESWDMRGDA